ncbi:MAG: UPF0280 family protein [Actinomycetota bacterium]|nr:UPF0280 family protein [Actinomycetota bacterium]
MGDYNNISVKRIFPEKFDADKSVYRSSIRHREKYNWRVIYKYSDLLISCDKDISGRVKKLLLEIYDLLESFIDRKPSFQKSLSPVKIEKDYPSIVKKMCRKAALFNVGPMATVAGAVCDYIASGLREKCGRLIIENGGDVYIRSSRDFNVGVYLKDTNFKDKIYLKIRSEDTPCGLCSSSGNFGHSLSMGSVGIVVVLSRSTISADGAATSIANRIEKSSDINGVMEQYSRIKELGGLLIVKDGNIGIWGDIELSGN